VLIESPRREINKLIRSDDSVRRVIDEHFIVRAIQSGFAPNASFEELRDVARGAALSRFRADEPLFREGDEADCLHLIRSGSVAVSRLIGGRDVVTSYVAAGNYLGEMGLMGRTRRSATAKATVATETVTLDAASFERLLEKNPRLREQVQETVRKRLAANAQMSAQPQAGDLISFFMQQGLGEATDVLLIDETLCIGCDNCEKACAETHGGTSRLDREAGPSFAQVHVPTSCRHCENPQCMTECPPDAIRRAANGEVYILDSCIGCGNCERNCPYGVIQMAAPAPGKPGLLSWLLFGMGPGPGAQAGAGTPLAHDQQAPKKAVKCDMCKDLAGGPACVRACPTGAAIRISPDQFVDLARGGGG
jgi:Fe-S-cluster-containing hydrogenase component 2